MGRPAKLTTEIQRIIVEAVAAGVPREHAAARAGVGRTTLFRWLAKGRSDKSGEYWDLWESVKKADADAVARNVAVIQRAAFGHDEVTIRETRKADGTVERVTTTRRVFDWCAAAWWLERRCPDNFALQRKRDIEDAVAKAMEKMMPHGSYPNNNSSPVPTTCLPDEGARNNSQSPHRPDAPDANGGDGTGPVAGIADPV